MTAGGFGIASPQPWKTTLVNTKSTRPLWQTNRATSAPAAGRKSPDWSKGWAAHPIQEGAPRYTIPVSGGHGATRLTFLDESIQNQMHIPGPGAYRSYEDFADPDLGRRSPRRRSPRKVRKQAARPWSAPVHHSNEGDGGAYNRGPSQTKEGLQVKANKVFSRRPFSASFPRTKRAISEPDYVPGNAPTSLSTPGPGAYTQYSGFGIASGACTKRYFAARKVDNPGGLCRPSKFGTLPPPREAVPVTLPISNRR
mmetsp:Transcript_63727/g.151912  ORF Transcript_63727/g.151912 Transcript_63727/m.151912 type:complete len:254 (+) Transcript_63727:37-798(+)